MTTSARIHKRFEQNRKANPAYINTQHVMMDVQGLAVDARYVLVDLSNITDFPHDGIDHILVRRLMVSVEQHSSGLFDINFGVVKEVDATNGSVAWFKKINFEVGGQDDFDFHYPNGLSLQLVSEEPKLWLSNHFENENTGWQTDVDLASPLSAVASVPPGAGDLVMLVDEISGTGTVDFNVAVEYDTV